MSEEIESKLNKIPIVRQLVTFTKAIKLSSLEGMSLYDILEMYISGVFKGAFSYRASSIAFSFFMALFPFALFILNLIPFIPLENFQEDFLHFIDNGVPPNTYYAIEAIVKDIMETSHQGLLSSGFFIETINLLSTTSSLPSSGIVLIWATKLSFISFRWKTILRPNNVSRNFAGLSNESNLP